MVATRICDVCKSKGKTVESTHYTHIGGRPDLRLDTCKQHNGKSPRTLTEYEKYVRKIKGWD